MKRLFTKFLFAALVSISTTSYAQTENANLTLGNAGNAYYGKYDDKTKMVTGIHFEVGADGTNSAKYVPAFEVRLYLLVPGTTDPIVVKTYNVADNTLHHFGTYTFDAESVDLSQTATLATGDYKIGAWIVASYDAKTSDNAGLLDPSTAFHYTKGVSTNPKPDLQIESVTYNFTNGVISDLKVKVKNAGTVDAPASDIKFTIETNGQSFDITADLDAVAAGTSITHAEPTIDFSTEYSSGTIYSFTVMVDDKSAIAESDETNNTKVINNITAGYTDRILAGEGIKISNPVSKSNLKSLSRGAIIEKVELFSASGAVLSIDEAAAGLYLVKFTTTKGIEVQRLIVE